ncbi:MAG: hypothetical protein IJB67_06100 [Firmicutes bacterium]|nr:hypothetical protein [Bacillota bacterium]
MRNYKNNFADNNFAYNDDLLNTPAILTSDDEARLQRLQNEFCSECGKDMILVAYKK